MSDPHYPPRMIVLLQAIWGIGFLSPGGRAEVARVIGGHELTGLAVLDIGCGVGGRSWTEDRPRFPGSPAGNDDAYDGDPSNPVTAMHDIRTIRDNPTAFDAALARRGHAAMSAEVLKIDRERRDAIKDAENLQAQQNTVNALIGRAITTGNAADLEQLKQQGRQNAEATKFLGKHADALDVKLRDLLLTLPNTPLDDAPDGPDESGNVELRRWGSPRAFDFAPAEHFDIAGLRPGLDFATAAKLSGSRFVVLRGAAARLQRALAQFMLDTHVAEHGLAEIWTPVLVKPEAMYGTNQLPKFAEDSYATTNGWWLIPTSEVTLTNTVAGDMLDEARLPIRLTAHTQCFRSEAGSAGKDTAGMLRQHQFE